MRPGEIPTALESHLIVTLDGPDLDQLLDASRVIREHDTKLAGWIRVLDLDGLVLVQEQTPEGEILLRRVDSEETARRFVDDRLATYDRMWDGCGCRVRYHE